MSSIAGRDRLLTLQGRLSHLAAHIEMCIRDRLATADFAPLYALPIAQAYLQRASTMGYTFIRHVRLVPAEKLSVDLGEEATEAIRSALAAFGLSEPI